MKKDQPLKSQLEDLFSDVALPQPESAHRPSVPVGEQAAQHVKPEIRGTSAALEELIADVPPPTPLPAPPPQARAVWRQRLERWWAIPTQDADLARKGQIVTRLLIPIFIAALAVIVLSIALQFNGLAFPVLLGLGLPIAAGSVALGSLVLIKRGQVHNAIRLFTVGLFAGCLALAYATPPSLGIALYFLWPITVAGLLLEPIHALWMAFAASGCTILLFALQEADVYRPIVSLTRDQESLLSLGNWSTIFITIGTLTYLVTRSRLRILRQERSLRAELVTQQDALAHQVAERTHLLQKANYRLQKRAIHLEASAQVSQAAISTLNPQELMQTTVDLIRTQFNFYHVSFFLLDETGEWAVVRASTGEVGKKMVAQPHRLAVGGASMVGWVCANCQPRITLDVQADEIHYDHPWLPKTKSEITLPLNLGNKLLGALDVQSTDENAFDDDDLRTLQGMADLVAVALENARLFASTRQVARRQRLVAKIAERTQQAASISDILQLSIQELGETFDLAEASICLGTEAELGSDGRQN